MNLPPSVEIHFEANDAGEVVLVIEDQQGRRVQEIGFDFTEACELEAELTGALNKVAGVKLGVTA